MITSAAVIAQTITNQAQRKAWNDFFASAPVKSTGAGSAVSPFQRELNKTMQTSEKLLQTTIMSAKSKRNSMKESAGAFAAAMGATNEIMHQRDAVLSAAIAAYAVESIVDYRV